MALELARSALAFASCCAAIEGAACPPSPALPRCSCRRPCSSCTPSRWSCRRPRAALHVPGCALLSRRGCRGTWRICCLRRGPRARARRPALARALMARACSCRRARSPTRTRPGRPRRRTTTPAPAWSPGRPRPRRSGFPPPVRAAAAMRAPCGAQRCAAGASARRPPQQCLAAMPGGLRALPSGPSAMPPVKAPRGQRPQQRERAGARALLVPRRCCGVGRWPWRWMRGLGALQSRPCPSSSPAR